MRKISKIQLLWMKIEAYFLEKKVNRDPQLRNAEPPPEVHEKILAEIHKRELQLEILSDEQKELIYLGQIHRRQLRRRKYWVLATAVVLALAVGMTSLGGVERVFHKISSMISNRTRETVDSGGVMTLTNISEEQAFAEIEEKYGFYPVRFGYRPLEVDFLEMNILQDIPKINIIYGTEERVRIVYDIIPNYRKSSFSKDIEDEAIEEYAVEVDGTKIEVSEYVVKESSEQRWLIQFEYKDSYYQIYIMDVEQNEIDRIVEMLHFI